MATYLPGSFTLFLGSTGLYNSARPELTFTFNDMEMDNTLEAGTTVNGHFIFGSVNLFGVDYLYTRNSLNFHFVWGIQLNQFQFPNLASLGPVNASPFVVPIIETGTGGPDIFIGDTNNDNLAGAAGDDTLQGNGGRDTLDGGEGNDSLEGNDDADLLIGGLDSDMLNGGRARDTLEGGDGNDTLLGGGGRDRLEGGTGGDTINGGNGRDVIFGGQGDDELNGGARNDAIRGGLGDDTLNGGTGDDKLIGGTLGGGSNSDTFVFADGDGNDTIVDFDALDPNEKIDLAAVTAITNINDLTDPGGAASQQGADVLIDTGGGNSILLLNVSLGDLDAGDFIF